MGYGIWASQFNVRSIATNYGPNVTQTGSANGESPQYLSQLLLDDTSPPSVTTGNSFGKAAANLMLLAKPYPSAEQATGLEVSLY